MTRRIAIALVVFVAWTGGRAVTPCRAAAAGSPPVASVNGEVITAEQVEVLGSAYFAKLRQEYGRSYTPEIEARARREVLNNIIDATLLRQEAARQGIVAPEARVDSVVASNDYFKDATGNTDWDKFARYKADANSNYRQLADNLRRLVMADMLTMSRRRALGAQVPDDSLRTLYERYTTERVGQLLLIRPDTIVAVEKSISEEDIGRLYLRRRESLRTTEVHLLAVRVRRSDFSVPTSEISDREVALYYGKHLPDYIDSTHASIPLEQVREKIRSRMSFERADAAARAEAGRLAATLQAGTPPARLASDRVTVDSATIFVSLTPSDPLYPDSLGQAAMRARPGDLLGPVSLGSSVAMYQVTQVTPRAVPGLAVVRDSLVRELLAERDAEKEAALRAYYEGHLDQYMSTDRYTLDYIVLRRLPKDPLITLPPTAVRQYYLTHKDQFTVPAEARAAHILIASGVGNEVTADSLAYVRADSLYTAIQSGADFGEVARAFSQDPGSAANGGDLGTFGRGKMVESFEQAAFSLPVGEVSRPVRSPFGFHLIKVLDRRDARVAAIDEVSGKIQVDLTKVAEQESLRVVGERIIRRLHAGRSFDLLAAPYGGTRRTDTFALGDPLPVLGKQVEVDRVLRTLRAGDVCPSPILTANGYLIFRVVEKLPPAPRPLDTIHDEVDRTYFRERQQGLALNWAHTIRDQVRAGGNFFTLSSGYGELKRVGPWRRGDNIEGLGFLTAAQEDTLAAVPVGGVACLSLTYGVAAVSITGLTPPAPADFERNKDAFRYRIGGEKYSDWFVEMKKKAAIKYFGKAPG